MKGTKPTYMEGTRRFAPALTKDLCSRNVKRNHPGAVRHPSAEGNKVKSAVGGFHCLTAR